MNRKIFSFLAIIGVLSLFPCCKQNSDITKKEEDTKPNIVLIYADDLGIGLLGHEGQKIIKTPNIDQLVEEGLRFTNAYSNMLCAPARASLISGLHDCHAKKFEITPGAMYKKISTQGLSHMDIGRNLELALSPIPDEAVFLGQVAREAEYRTTQIGKLEWGFSTTHQQMERHGWEIMDTSIMC